MTIALSPASTRSISTIVASAENHAGVKISGDISPRTAIAPRWFDRGCCTARRPGRRSTCDFALADALVANLDVMTAIVPVREPDPFARDAVDVVPMPRW